MKKTNIIYWISTILFAAGMAFSAIPDVVLSEEALSFMAQLGYPLYFTVFIGAAKLLGVAVILIPGFPRIKEWAYAGLFFDLIGAIYSVACVAGVAAGWPILIFALPGVFSYIYHHKRLKERR